MNILSSLFRINAALTDEQADEISRLFSARTARREDCLLQPGAMWNEAIYVESGILRLYYTTEDGKEFNKGLFFEGQLLWPMAPSARDNPSLFAISAVEACTLQVADFSRLREKLTQCNAWERFALPYAENLANQKFLREYQFLVYDAQQRYELLLDELGPLAHRLPDYHLASYLGITHIALSRIKARMRAGAPAG